MPPRSSWGIEPLLPIAAAPRGTLIFASTLPCSTSPFSHTGVLNLFVNELPALKAFLCSDSRRVKIMAVL